MTNTVCPSCGTPRSTTVAEGLCPHCLLAGLLEVPPADRLGEEAGDPVGPYELVELIGEGGMGSVWRASQLHPVEREVALKIIKLGMDTREVVSRFEAERQSLAAMDHPGIARVFEAGSTVEGRPYFVMELVAGEPITDYCRSRNLPLEERLRLFMEVCAAVEHAHRKGIIHRDLKPSNVLVAESGEGPRPKVIDFGIAKTFGGEADGRTFATRAGYAVGTPGYMSPEQAGAEKDIDTRADVYSLGALLYEMLTGSAPLGKETFREAAHAEVMRLIRETDPPRPSTRAGPTTAVTEASPLPIARDLDCIVMKALARERERRYGGATALGDDVRRFLDHEPVSATDPTLAYRAGKFVRKHRLPVALAAGIVLALVAGIWMARHEAGNARRAAGQAEAARAETQSALANTYRNIGLERSHERNDSLAALWFALARTTAAEGSDQREANRVRSHLSTMRSPVPVRYLERHEPWQSYLRFDGSGRFLLEGSFGGEHVFFDLESGGRIDLGFEAAAGALLREEGVAGLSRGDGAVEIRNLGTGEVLQTFELPGEEVSSLWASHDGDLLFAGHLNPRVWSRKAAAFVAGPYRHPLPLRFGQFSPGGTRLFTVDEKGDLRVFAVEDGGGEPLMPPVPTASRTHFDPYFPRFLQDGSQIVVRSDDKICRIHLGADGGRLEAVQDRPDGSDVTGDGRWITGFNGIRDLDSGQARFNRPIGNGAFTPGDGLLYGNGLAEFLDYDGVRQSMLPARGGRWQFSPDGALMAHRMKSGIMIYQIARPEPFLRVSAPHAGRIALTSDERLFASAGWGRRQRASTFARVFRVEDGQPVGPPIDTGYQHLAAAFLPGSETLVTGGGDRPAVMPPGADGGPAEGEEWPGVLQAWDPASGRRLAGPLVLPSEPCAMRAHPAEGWVAVLCWNGDLLRVEPSLEGFELLQQFGGKAHGAPNSRAQGSLAFSEDGRTIYANGFDRRVFAIDLDSGKLRFPALQQVGYGTSLTVQGGVLYSPTPDHRDEWSFMADTGEALPLPKEAKPYMPMGFRVSKDNRRYLVSTPSLVSLVEMPEGNFVGPGHSAGPPSFVYSEFVEGTPWILSAIGPKLEPPSLRLWDSRTGLELGPRWRLGGLWVADSATTSDGRQMIVSVQGVGYVIVKVAELLEELSGPDDLAADERLRFAELVAMRRIVDGRPVPFASDSEWGGALEEFRRRHPGRLPLLPARSELLRWHRNQEAIHGPESPSGRWHRARAGELGD